MSRPAEWNQACRGIRMDAYYYGFEGTGAREIDLILSAVAWAGKSYHHTQSWTDEDYGESEAAKIQRAADEAATEVRRLRDTVQRVRAVVDEWDTADRDAPNHELWRAIRRALDGGDPS